MAMVRAITKNNTETEAQNLVLSFLGSNPTTYFLSGKQVHFWK